MSSKFLSVLAGVALAASATSAFAFDAVLGVPKGLHTHPWHRSAVIELLPAGTVVNILGARRGGAEVTAPNGVVGFVYTPVLASAVPAPGWWWGWGAWPVAEVVAPAVPVAVAAPVAPAPVVAAAPVAPAPVAARTAGIWPWDWFAPAAAPVAPAPVVASY